MWGDKASGEIVAPIVPSPKILEIKPKFQVGLLKIFIYTDAFMSYIACIQTGGQRRDLHYIYITMYPSGLVLNLGRSFFASIIRMHYILKARVLKLNVMHNTV